MERSWTVVRTRSWQDPESWISIGSWISFLLFSLINPGRILYGLWQKTLTIPWFFCSKSYYDPTKPWLHTSFRIQGILDRILILRNSKPVQILLNRTSYPARILLFRGYTLLSGFLRFRSISCLTNMAGSFQTVATHFSQEKVVSLGKNSESLQEPYCILEWSYTENAKIFSRVMQWQVLPENMIVFM